MIKTLVGVVITGILGVKMVSGIAGMVSTAATVLSALVLLTAYVEVLPLLLIATATDESPRRGADSSSLVV